MRKMIFTFAVMVVALFISVTLTLAQKDKNNEDQHGGKPMMVELSGGMEVPGPGDPDGNGTARLTLNHGQGQLCYDITVKNIQTPTAAHIHAGAAGQAGDVKVSLKANADNTWKGCVAADKTLVKQLMDNPTNFYLNVHNAEFPNGAVRGQLGK